MSPIEALVELVRCCMDGEAFVHADPVDTTEQPQVGTFSHTKLYFKDRDGLLRSLFVRTEFVK